MNTTDYFTNINAMFLFCIFTCGLLVWAVIRGFNIKRDANEDLKKAHDRIKQSDMDIANEMRKYDTLFKQHIECGKRIIALEVAKDNAEKESRDLRKQLIESESQANGYKAEFIAVSNELEATKAKVRKRDNDGKFLPSGNGRVRTPKKLKLVTDLGENECILCTTPKQRLAIRTLMHEAGMKWATGHSYMDKEYFTDYGKNLYYMPSNGTHGSAEYVFEGLMIHPASDFIARPKRVKKVKAAFNELSDHAKEASAALDNFSKLVSTTTLPKLVRGLTVKNPTEAEAKMIFDEARRLGVECDKSKLKNCPWIWVYIEKGIGPLVTFCTTEYSKHRVFVTAQEFVQRMQNGRG